MKEIIAMLAEAFSTNELTAILRDISNDKLVSDNTFRILSCALCLSWIDSEDIKEVMNLMDSCDSD